jgi:lipopolysaccharide transport system ATP-binding protein
MGAIIRLRGVSLSIPIYVQPERRARSWSSMLFGAAFDPPRRVFAKLLDEIDFEASDGDRVAVLGRNGAGKSTFLRVLNGVYPPSAGSIRVEGSCQALLNMSLGFNGEATVRENVFLRGTAMRLRASELRDKIDQILEFAGLQEKASHRLRTLSSGQRMRLGFAISTSVQHDIILMDEWVGAGDSAFMARATERMRGHMGGSSIVVLASHSVGLLRDICNKGVVLEQGQLVFAGDILPALAHYHELMDRVRMDEVAHVETASLDGTHVYGCVEEFVVDDSMVRLKGWMVSVDGSVPDGLALEVRGIRHLAESVVPGERPDVKRHFGLKNSGYGFVAEFRIEGVGRTPLGADVRVLGGGGSAPVGGVPLRLAPAVTTALAAHASPATFTSSQLGRSA